MCLSQGFAIALLLTLEILVQRLGKLGIKVGDRLILAAVVGIVGQSGQK